MKILLVLIVTLFNTSLSFSQNNSLTENRVVVCFSITEDPIQLPNNKWEVRFIKNKIFDLKTNQTFIVKGIFENNVKDSVTVGEGIIKLILGNKIVAHILNIRERAPKKNDIVCLLSNNSFNRNDILFNLSRYAISFLDVEEKNIVSPNFVFEKWNDSKEDSIINEMKEDIIYTAKKMIEASDNQNIKIAKGNFEGKMLFDAMQQITNLDVKKFLRFAYYKKHLYWGKQWKISETFATWLINGAITIKN